MSKKIIIIQTGQPAKPVLDKFGDFDQWFIQGMRIDPAQTKTFRVYEKPEFPDIAEIAGVIITGSPAMVTEKCSWSEDTINWLESIKAHKFPILGVCYGHQMLATLLGGEVNWNPKGRQIGQVEVSITAEMHTDRLFAAMLTPDVKSITFMASHQQSVIKPPSEAIRLGYTTLDCNHCFSYNNHIWGLQFHPEFSAEVTREYVRVRSTDIEKEGMDPVKLLNSIEETDNGNVLLQRFKDICFEKPKNQSQ
jgi:GMP synthase (glutamine-hydrolysing)